MTDLEDDPRFDEVIETSSDPEEMVRAIRDALGMEEGETLHITTPQFERIDDVEVGPAPVTTEAVETMKHLDEDDLRDLGLQRFGEYGLWLLPYEWHPHVPRDYEFLTILGERQTRDDYPATPDKRFGALSFGIVPDFEDVPERGHDVDAPDGYGTVDEAILDVAKEDDDGAE